jgi:hypothetical protein
MAPPKKSKKVKGSSPRGKGKKASAQPAELPVTVIERQGDERMSLRPRQPKKKTIQNAQSSTNGMLFITAYGHV